ncbi:MAG: diguanylate cyclase [Clostridia bacterium]|nr:diguanylate cyclase [Clostridia bacterium]
MENNRYIFLAIDDHHENLITLKALLNEAFPKAEVLTALSGKEGIALAGEKEPDVILLDIVMPGMDGYQVCRCLKSHPKLMDVPVMFITALKGDKQSRILALESGAETFLAKPIDEIELFAQVRAMLKIKASNIQKRDEKKMLQAMVECKTQKLLETNKQIKELYEEIKEENELRKMSEIALHKAKEKYRSLLDDLPAWICEFLPDSTLVYVNKAYCKYLEMSLDDLIGQKFLGLLTEGAREEAEKQYKALTSDHPSNQYAHEVIKNGEIRWQEWRHRAFFTEQGQPAYYYSIGMDVTERKRVEEELIYLSYHDHLTGLYNRRFFENELKRLDMKANFPVTVVMGDVNGLKLINDSFGHAAGDEILKKAATTIRKGCIDDEIIARIGGDEFAIILPKTDKLETERMIRRIKELILVEKTGQCVLSISFGYKTKYSEEDDIQTILAEAENNMYKQKMYESASMRSKTIDVIMNALYEKSEREMLHSKRVSAISAAIAAELGFNQDKIEQIKIAGLVHDIGKIGIDEKILNKTHGLDNDEWLEMKKHPEVGWRILASANEFLELARYILSHHERWDGKGYPNGLKGEEIDIEARIITIADAYDAMTSKRSYRKPVSKEEAISEIKKCSGTQFDPKIVDIFVKKVVKYI